MLSLWHTSSGQLALRTLRHGLPQLFTSGVCPKSLTRPICTTNINFVKKVVIKEEGDNITVEGVPYESERTPYLVKLPDEEEAKVEREDKTLGNFLFNKKHKYCGSCPLCRLNLTRLCFSDVLILQQFIHSDGTLMFREETGLCPRSFSQVKQYVKQAQKAKLLPRPPTFESFGPWDDLPRYYEHPRRHRDLPIRIIRKQYWDDGMQEH